MIKNHVSLHMYLDNERAVWGMAGMKVFVTAWWQRFTCWCCRREMKKVRTDSDTITETHCVLPAFSLSCSCGWKSTSGGVQKSSASPPKVLVIQNHNVTLKLRHVLYKPITCTVPIHGMCREMPLPIHGHFSKLSSLENLRGTETSET